MAKMNAVEKFFVNSWLDVVFHKFFGIAKLLKNVEEEGFSNILEIGSGVGITTKFIQKKFPNSRITATDYDFDQVVEARRRLDSSIMVQQADATQLSFDDSNFDACFAILTFHHIENSPKAITEVYRVLKPGGKLYVIDIPAKHGPLFHLRSSMNLAPGFFSKEEFDQTIKQAGFRILSNEGKRMFRLIAQK